VYLHLELLTDKNSSAWKTYKSFAEKFAGPGDSLTASLPSHINVSQDADGHTHYVYSSDNHEMPSNSGYTHSEFETFTQLLGKNGFHVKGDREFLLENNNPECLAWYSYNQYMPEKYIVYATTTPTFNITDIPITKKNQFTIKLFLALYSDLIVTVGADFATPGYIENRGIFRNPYHVIHNSYKGLSMTLHGFSAAVALKFFKNKQTLLIRPMDSMFKIIVKTLDTKDYTIAGEIEAEPRVEVKLPALELLYRNSQHHSGFFYKRSKDNDSPVVKISREELMKEMGFG
tara:strand:+ start:190 stop:1053 length:864 start_codon:yes stop_codon:yes gene_type:complete